MPKFTTIEGSVTAPAGFRAAGVFCDIKRLGTGKGSEKGAKRDLALIVSDAPAVAAGTFTTNRVCAAPVKLCAQRMAVGKAQAIVVNSGNANACTGLQGWKDALEMARYTAAALEVPEKAVLVASTGRIGVPLPMARVRQGIAQAAKALGNGSSSARHAVEAIMTSDTRPKQIALQIRLGGKTIRLGAMCKGAGMIQPGMSASGQAPAARNLHATMLCFLTTDAAISREPLQAALQEAVADSFNRITVDGDMSTNDTVLMLANGRAENPMISSVRHRDFRLLQSAVNHACLELAKMIVRDGEGVSRFVTVRVSGARSYTEADAAARAVANSALVKTSWCGGDPNWGRILCALGYSTANIAEEKIDVGYSLPGDRKIVYAVRKGRTTAASFRELCQITGRPEFDLWIGLNLGRADAVIYASDLTEAYVDFNKGDVSDPKSLGG